MTAALPLDTGQLGPGTLTIGLAGDVTPLDISCYINNVSIKHSTSKGTQTYKLCGVARAGVNTTTFSLEGNVDVDLANGSGLLALSWDSINSLCDFEYTPNNELGVKFTGQCVIDALDIEAADYGSDITSAFAWDIVGKPSRVLPPGVTPTGAVSGVPGHVTPLGANVPANLAGMTGIVASPTTAWAAGTYILLGDNSIAKWSGTAWVVA